jgi:hypothetical protein
MNSFIKKNHRLLFYACWLILGLIQSGLTELQDDEAYYWVYSRYPAWGYFDHPPMTGLLIKMGYAIFPNQLGVRLFPLLLNLLSLLIIEKLISKKNHWLFYIIVLSIAVLQLSGFAAVPDIPLIFFTALFFWCYKKFVADYSLLHTFLLGLSVALLCYSKYHAVLIVLFTLLSNIKLFTRYQTYIAGVVALLLFAPHLWWQYEHDWVSIRYHLFESNVNSYKLSFTLNYIVGQLLLPGPIAGFILLPAAFLYKPVNELEKALRFTLIGIYAFFLLSSFRGQVEANWTSPVLVSLIVLSHGFLIEKTKWQKVLYKLLPVTLLLVVLARVVMITDILPIKAISERFHSWKEWPQEMRQRTKGLPVVFNNSYQRASKYWYYSGQPTYSLNHYRGRRNNFNFWPLEDSLLGKPAYMLDIYDMPSFHDSLHTPIGWVGYRYDDAFVSFAKIKISVTPSEYTLKQGEELQLKCRFDMPEHYAAFISSHPQLNDSTRVGIFSGKKWIKDIFPPITLQQMIDQKTPERLVTIQPNLPKGKYYLRFAINCGPRYPTHNSDKIGLTIE